MLSLLLMIAACVGGLWLLVCFAIWVWFFFLGGNDQDFSGDLGLVVLLLPIVPIVLGYQWVRSLFRKEK